jgi:hypothetical protein
MVVTRGGSYTAGDPHPGGSKNIVASRSPSPDYSTTSSTVPDSSGGANDQAAKEVYGVGAGTRMSRVAGEAQQAAAQTPGSGDTNASPPFIGGQSFRDMADAHPAADVPGNPGFPGGDDYYTDVEKIPERPATRVSTAGGAPQSNPSIAQGPFPAG